MFCKDFVDFPVLLITPLVIVSVPVLLRFLFNLLVFNDMRLFYTRLVISQVSVAEYNCHQVHMYVSNSTGPKMLPCGTPFDW